MTVAENHERGWKQFRPRFFVRIGSVDRILAAKHFTTVKTLLEIENAITKLPAAARRKLIQDMPALCPDVFPADGWDAILQDSAPRPALKSMLDKLDAEYSEKSESYLTLNDKSLRSKK